MVCLSCYSTATGAFKNFHQPPNHQTFFVKPVDFHYVSVPAPPNSSLLWNSTGSFSPPLVKSRSHLLASLSFFKPLNQELPQESLGLLACAVQPIQLITRSSAQHLLDFHCGHCFHLIPCYVSFSFYSSFPSLTTSCASLSHTQHELSSLDTSAMSQMFVGFSIPIRRALATSFLAFFEVLSCHSHLSFLPRVSTFPGNTIQERARCTTHIPFLRTNTRCVCFLGVS